MWLCVCRCSELLLCVETVVRPTSIVSKPTADISAYSCVFVVPSALVWSNVACEIKTCDTCNNVQHQNSQKQDVVMFLSLKSTRPRRRLRPHGRPLSLEASRVVFLTLQTKAMKSSKVSRGFWFLVCARMNF